MPSRAERLRTAGACVASGVALCLSLPPFGFWPLAIVGLVGLDRLIANQPAGHRFRRGWLVAMGCFVPSLSWMTALTPPGYVIACAAYAGMLGVGVMAAPPGPRALAGAGRHLDPRGAPAVDLALRRRAARQPRHRPGRGAARRRAPRRRRACCWCSSPCWSARRWPPPSGGAWWPAVGLAALVALVLAGSAIAPDGYSVGSAEVALVQGGGRAGDPQDRHRRRRGVRAPCRRHRARRAARRPRRLARGRHRHRRGLRGRPVGRRWSATSPPTSTPR